jgi:hypothetical protein
MLDQRGHGRTGRATALEAQGPIKNKPVQLASGDLLCPSGTGTGLAGAFGR